MSTTPSPGAMQAATRIMTADDPARIIDEETGAGELAKALRNLIQDAEQCAPGFHQAPSVIYGRAILSRYTSAKENPAP